MTIVVAIQGEPGCYSHDAARQALGEDVCLRSYANFGEVFEALLDARVSLAVVPVENTILGPIRETRTLIRRSGAREVSETGVPVRHCLIMRNGGDPAAIRRIASHPAALAQCATFLRARPDWTPVPVADTAGGVRALAAGTLAADAAIASRRAAMRYGCRVVLDGIQDALLNVTRFAVLAPPAA